MVQDVDDWNYEGLTEEEARRRHSDCELVEVVSIVDRSGERRDANFVWDTVDFVEGLDDDGKRPRAVYWLKR